MPNDNKLAKSPEITENNYHLANIAFRGRSSLNYKWLTNFSSISYKNHPLCPLFARR